jgi:glycosyltransferase involved in cell wall biosynthesis
MTYPRVLIVYHSCINKADATGVSIRNWFADWPKDHLAQIYSGNEIGDERFCGRSFCLGRDERRFSRMFFRLKASPLGDANRQAPLERGGARIETVAGRYDHLKQRCSSLAIRSGIWELIFPPVISMTLAAWITDFNPDIVYAQGYDLSFAWLAVWIMKRFGLPGCFHAVDDWPRFLYREGIFSRLMRPYVDDAARALIESSCVRYSIGRGMADAYRSRYGVDIEPLMICDNLQRFRDATPRRLVPDDCISIIYTGGLGHYRWRALVDLAAAARILENEGRKVRIITFTPAVPPEAVKELSALTHIQFEPLPSHEALPGILKGGDILYLPETFDAAEADVIRLSVSTKAPLYMMSGKPILVYSSPVTGVMTYARNSGWGYRVERQDVRLLADAVRRLHTDPLLRKTLAEKSLTIAEENHEGAVVRERLRRGLLRAARRADPPGCRCPHAETLAG